MASTTESMLFVLCREIEFAEEEPYSLLGLIDWLTDEELRRGVPSWVFAQVRPLRNCKLSVTVVAPNGKAREMVRNTECSASTPMATGRWDGVLSREGFPWDGVYEFLLLADNQPIAWQPLLVGSTPSSGGFPIRSKCLGPLLGNRRFFVPSFVPCAEAVQDDSEVWSILRVYDGFTVRGPAGAPTEIDTFCRGLFLDEMECRVRVTAPDRSTVWESPPWTMPPGGCSTHKVRAMDVRFQTPGVYLFDLLCGREVAATYRLEVNIATGDG